MVGCQADEQPVLWTSCPPATPGVSPSTIKIAARGPSMLGMVRTLLRPCWVEVGARPSGGDA